MDILADPGPQVSGLPLHPLIVHAVVVLVPLTALALLLSTFWPAARRRLGVVTPLAALVALILVPITVWAGEALAAQVGLIPAVQTHEGWGRMLLPWVMWMFVVALGQWIWYRWGVPRVRERSRTATRVMAVVWAALAVVTAGGALVIVILTGESGARAVWG